MIIISRNVSLLFKTLYFSFLHRRFCGAAMHSCFICYVSTISLYLLHYCFRRANYFNFTFNLFHALCNIVKKINTVRAESKRWREFKENSSIKGRWALVIRWCWTTGQLLQKWREGHLRKVLVWFLDRGRKRFVKECGGPEKNIEGRGWRKWTEIRVMEISVQFRHDYKVM